MRLVAEEHGQWRPDPDQEHRKQQAGADEELFGLGDIGAWIVFATGDDSRAAKDAPRAMSRCGWLGVRRTVWRPGIAGVRQVGFVVDTDLLDRYADFAVVPKYLDRVVGVRLDPLVGVRRATDRFAVLVVRFSWAAVGVVRIQ